MEIFDFKDPKKTSRVAGLMYLGVIVFGIMGQVIRMSFIVHDDAAKTVSNIMANEMLFRIGIFSFIVMVIFDVVLAWALYVLLKPVSKSLALLAAWLRLVNGTIFGIACTIFLVFCNF